MDAVHAKRSSEDFSAELAQKGWYHSSELPSKRSKGFSLWRPASALAASFRCQRISRVRACSTSAHGTDGSRSRRNGAGLKWSRWTTSSRRIFTTRIAR